jgi:hypothetical protein
MSDRDASHLLTELQEARHLADSNQKAFLKANERCVELMDEVERLRDLLRWRDAWGEPPTEEGIYLVINNDFDGCTSIHATYWKGKWPIGFTVPYWRPIGSLPGE